MDRDKSSPNQHTTTMRTAGGGALGVVLPTAARVGGERAVDVRRGLYDNPKVKTKLSSMTRSDFLASGGSLGTSSYFSMFLV